MTIVLNRIRRLTSLSAVLVTATLAVAACVGAAPASLTPPSAAAPSTGATSAPSTAAGSAPAASATGGPSASGAPSGSRGPTQTTTAWGRIWDSIPPAFPRYAGSTPTETGRGPMSAEFTVPGAAPDVVTTWLAAALAAAGWTNQMAGPLEDGSRQINSTGADGCLAQTTVVRLGGTTTVSVLYGAACPVP